jgi:iron(II)-dependent oxidoreductase
VPEATGTPEASPLPDNAAEGQQLTPSQTVDNGAASGQAVGTEEAAEPAAVMGDTPVVGTPPIGSPTQTITFAGTSSIPPELEAVKSPLEPVSGGTFMMGTTLEEGSQAVDECALYEATCNIADIQDSTPAHQVTVDSFQMEVYEVSVTQYVAFLNFLGPNTHKSMCQGQPCVMTVTDEPTSYIEFDGTTYSVRNPEFYSNHPVTWVTWWGAQEYCRQIGRRLPTEAEWERAARGPQNFIYPWGFEYEVTFANSSRPAAEGTEPVDSYPTGGTVSGIYNLAGNVEEWVADWYQLNYYAQSEPANPKGPTTGTEKVLRGGSWDTLPLFLRSVHRRSLNPGQSTAAIGFRCVESGSPTNVTPPTGPVDDGTGEDTGDTVPGGAPTLGPAATATPAATTLPAGPTPTIDPGQ